MRRVTTWLLLLGPLGWAALAHGSATGVIQARLVISAACQVDSGLQPASLGSPGVLDFGPQAPRWQTPLRGQVDSTGSGNLQISCSPQVRAFNVVIDQGQNGAGGMRQLSNGRVLIPYRLSLDPGGSRVYPIGEARTFSVRSTEQVPIPIYGVLQAQPRALPAGLYRDTLRVTLDW